jgi:hypothetical protein
MTDVRAWIDDEAARLYRATDAGPPTPEIVTRIIRLGRKVGLAWPTQPVHALGYTQPSARPLPEEVPRLRRLHRAAVVCADALWTSGQWLREHGDVDEGDRPTRVWLDACAHRDRLAHRLDDSQWALAVASHRWLARPATEGLGEEGWWFVVARVAAIRWQATRMPGAERDLWTVPGELARTDPFAGARVLHTQAEITIALRFAVPLRLMCGHAWCPLLPDPGDDPFGCTCLECGEPIGADREWAESTDGPVHLACADG